MNESRAFDILSDVIFVSEEINYGVRCQGCFYYAYINIFFSALRSSPFNIQTRFRGAAAMFQFQTSLEPQCPLAYVYINLKYSPPGGGGGC